tara:strand:+ start:11544 stop:12860 length:1317 start_codon:yes stop_codon:yes gene_type:complete
MEAEELFDLQVKNIRSWNNTYSKKAKTLYPKNVFDLKKIMNFLKKEKKNYIIKTGECSYDGKSITENFNTYVISLKKLDKVIKINKKRGIVSVQSGAIISDIIKLLKGDNLTLFSVPGGERISVGGAISANAIGKDSSKTIGSFGDSIESLCVLSEKNEIIKLRKNSKKLKYYIGSFGLSGIILEAELKTKKMKSPNLLLKSRILNDMFEVENELKKVSDYKYIQLDPFFRKKNFAIVFSANSTNHSNKIYQFINLKKYFYEKMFFKLSSYFINFFTWRIFYKLFFVFNKNKNHYVDIHNFHYSSKYKHMLPLIANNGINDYEILIKKDFIKNMEIIINYLKKKKLYAVYIIMKKIYKSKKKFFYQFNDNGYAVAIALKKDKNQKDVSFFFKNLIKKKNIKINLSKTDNFLINKIPKRNNLFMSKYKKMVLKNNGLSR